VLIANTVPLLLPQVYLAGLGLVTILVGWQALRHRLYARLAASAKDTKRD
jgi:hypothetical protein